MARYTTKIAQIKGAKTKSNNRANKTFKMDHVSRKASDKSGIPLIMHPAYLWLY